MESKARELCSRPSVFPPCAPSVVDRSVPPTPGEVDPETPLRLRPPPPRTLHRQFLVLHRWPWLTDKLHAAFPAYRGCKPKPRIKYNPHGINNLTEVNTR